MMEKLTGPIQNITAHFVFHNVCHEQNGNRIYPQLVTNFGAYFISAEQSLEDQQSWLYTVSD